jgi:hypothetical protein
LLDARLAIWRLHLLFAVAETKTPEPFVKQAGSPPHSLPPFQTAVLKMYVVPE